MGVKIVRPSTKQPEPEADSPPWDDPVARPLTPLETLKSLQPQESRTLTLVSKRDGSQYLVLGFDPATSVIKLKNQKGREFHVPFTEREDQFYEPVWR